MHALSVQSWSAENESRALSFLKFHYATSMFLLGNFADQGAKLSQHPNSGNFKVIEQSSDDRVSAKDEVLGVFSLTRRGILLVTVNTANTKSTDMISLIVKTVLEENISIRGVIGEYEIASLIWDYLKSNQIVLSTSFQSKEILYSLNSLQDVQADAQVRFLCVDDFGQWLPMCLAYLKEEGLKNDLSEQTMKDSFIEGCAERKHWGLFSEQGRLISIAALNARAFDVGQVGGVYTLPEFRRQGVSRRTMRQMLTDCLKELRLSKMILFTGEKNDAAQKVYEGLRFQRIGHFGMFFS